MRYLKTNTAVTICVGPMLDKTDGVTAEVALTTSNCKITAIAETDDNSAPTLILDNVAGNDGTNTLTHISGDDAGYYSLKLTAANLNRLGRFTVTVQDAANHCPVFHEYMIVPANVYDALVLGTDLLDASAAQIGGQTATAAGAVTVGAYVGNATAALASDANGRVQVQSGTGAGQISLSSGEVTPTAASKTGYALAATGADLILKSSTFVQAIVAAVNEFATYGLTALNTLLVTTGIKATLAAGDVSGNLPADVKAYTVQPTVTGATLDAAYDAAKTAASASALATVAGYVDTEVGSIKAVTDKLDTALEADGGVYRLTTNALEQAPTGSGLDAAGVRGAIGLAAANLDTQLAALPTDADVTAAVPSAATIAAAVWGTTVDGVFTAIQLLRGIAASAFGKLSGAATATVTIRNPSDTKDVLTATVDADGNRSAVTKDLT